MSDVINDIEEDLVPCRDPDCSGQAEEEVDGNVRYRVCVTCGFEFAYERVEVDAAQEVCQIGIPEDLRRAASGPMEEALAPKMLPLTVRTPNHDNQAEEQASPNEGVP